MTSGPETETASLDDIASEILAALDECRQIEPLTARASGLTVPEAYRVTAAVRQAREARGERIVGRKIGFTNTRIWDEYGVHAPIWGYVYDSTVRDLDELPAGFDASALVEPRIEPEIVLGLGRAPEPGMDERALMSCLAFVAHGFEIVQSLYPGWRFAAADTVAAFGLHGALLLGPKVAVAAADGERWVQRLRGFRIALRRDGIDVDSGLATNVMGAGPLAALAHLVRVLADDPGSPPLAAGEIVSTGTLTRAFPISPGETWRTALAGLPLDGIGIRLAASKPGA